MKPVPSLLRCAAALFTLASMSGAPAAATDNSPKTIAIRGVVTAVDRNVEPPTITVNAHGSARTIAVNSDARVYIEDVAIGSRVLGALADVRVGDALLALLSSDGKVQELHAFFRSSSGAVSAVSPTAIVIAGGSVVMPAAATEVSLNGSAAKVGDIQIGDQVTVRRNPETGELRQLIATRKVTSAAPPATGVKIASFSISATRPLRAGEAFDVTLLGTPGGTASFDIGNYVTATSMPEEKRGLYHARFLIPERFNLAQVPVYGHLSVNGTDAPRAEAADQLSASTTPPAIVDVAPPAGESVNTTRPNVYATFVSPSEVGIDPSSIQVVVNGKDVTSSATRAASFITYSPGNDYPDGPVSVTVRVADAAGNVASRSWSFTIKTR